jgi:hypothetical protein
MSLASRIVVALGAGTVAFCLIVGIFLFIEEPWQVPFAYAVSPGLFLQQLLENLGQEHTNRFAFWVTLVFWWIVAFCVVNVLKRRRRTRQIPTKE